jgi:hypothetical protein
MFDFRHVRNKPENARRKFFDMDPRTLVSFATSMYLDIVNSIEMDALILSTLTQLALMLSKIKFRHKTKYVQKTKPRSGYKRSPRYIQQRKHSKISAEGPLALQSMLLFSSTWFLV